MDGPIRRGKQSTTPLFRPALFIDRYLRQEIRRCVLPWFGVWLFGFLNLILLVFERVCSYYRDLQVRTRLRPRWCLHILRCEWHDVRPLKPRELRPSRFELEL